MTKLTRQRRNHVYPPISKGGIFISVSVSSHTTTGL